MYCSLFYNCFGDILLGVIKDQSCSSSTVGFVLVVVWRPFTVWVHSSSYPGCFNMVVRSRYWLITVFDKVSRYFPPWRMFCSHVSCFSTIQSVAIHATVWTMNILHVNVAIQVSTLHDSTSLRQQSWCCSLPQVMNDDDMLCRCDNYDPSTYCKYCAEAELDFVFPRFSIIW